MAPVVKIFKWRFTINMAESRYEKYVCRKPEFLEKAYRENLVNTQTMPPYIYSNGDHPIKDANQFVEVKWVWAPNVLGGEPGEAHYHEFDEMFIWLGTNKEDPYDLGGEVELWLGDEGKDRDKVTFTTSTLIFVPKGLRHLPIVYKRVDRPMLHLAIGINSGEHKMLQ